LERAVKGLNTKDFGTKQQFELCPSLRNIFWYLPVRRMRGIQGLANRTKFMLTKSLVTVLHPAASHFIDSNIITLSLLIFPKCFYLLSVDRLSF
jgi:hypothetical protein